ncbi:hypothetical protein VTI28DRAFT_8356 [Corynascus sepedonium]
MFDGRVPPDGHYELKEHLCEIVDLFGLFPKELLEKGNQDIVRSIFDEDGKPKGYRQGLVPPLEAEAFMPGLDKEARDGYASFLRMMMKVNPAERLSPEELLEHPWVGVQFSSEIPVTAPLTAIGTHSVSAADPESEFLDPTATVGSNRKNSNCLNCFRP